jgi:hypothetical protein
MQSRTAAAVAVAATIVISGCGGSTKTVTEHPPASSAGPQTSTNPSEAPTKTQFIKQADAICTSATAALKDQQKAVNAAADAVNTSNTATNRRALAEAMRNAIDVASPMLDKLRALDPPAADRVTISKYLDGIATQIDLLSQFARAVDSNDGSAVTSLSQQLDTERATTKGLAQGYGFKYCGSGSS